MSLRVGICGLGLIGSSLARALGPDAEVLGLDPSPQARETAAAIGVTPVADLAELAGCDLVALAAPTGANHRVLDRLLDSGPRVPTMDLGSVKVPIEQVWLRDPAFPFVGTHPMAGSERSGAAAGSADLFRGSAWPVVVTPQTDAAALRLVLSVILRVGARPVPMSAERHDDAVALASHLPHLLSGVLGATVAGSPLRRSALVLAAGSFRDVSRVSASPPERTAEFVTANARRAAETARTAALWLERAAELLTAGDADALAALLTRGHLVREEFDGMHGGADGGTEVHVATEVELRNLLVAERDSGRSIAAVDAAADGTGFAVRLGQPLGPPGGAGSPPGQPREPADG